MRPEPEPSLSSDVFERSLAHSALLVSALSVAWTAASSSIAIAIGVRTHTSVLVAFGAIGVVDAVGSLALAYHFVHGLRHDALSDELEKIAHVVVLVGLFSVGCAAAAGGAWRLAFADAGEASGGGVAVAAVSLFALAALSARKQQVARRIASKALLSDGHLSAVGAMQAAVTLAGTGLSGWFGSHWADPAATALVGAVAIGVAVATWRTERAASRDVRA